MIAVAALAVLSGLAVTAVVGTHSAAKASKLRGDVITINAAIKVYIASGGDISEAKTTDQVLTRLKSKASAENARRLTGLSSSVVDQRLACRMQSPDEAKGSSPRARWDQSEMQFFVESSGAAGIKEFYFDDAGDEGDNIDQRAGRVLFAKESGWIWDYQDRTPDVIPGPSVVALGTPTTPPLVPPVASLAKPSAPKSSPTPLTEPVFSPPGGTFPLNSFPMPVTLTNPNPPGVSKISYSIDSTIWQDYSAALSIPEDTPIIAMAVALDPAWTHSGMVSETYQSERVTLTSPTISPSADTFGFFSNESVTVILNNPNPPGVSITRYRINGSVWQDYSTPFLLDATVHGIAGATIESQAVPDNSPSYLPSPVAQAAVGRQSITLAGSTNGAFRNPAGPSGMVSNLNSGGSNSLFKWGDATRSSNYSESWMKYTGAGFTDIADSARFVIGELTYYNGTIKKDSGADTIDLSITLTVDINGQTFYPYFEFTFELVNTVNVAGDEWGSADFVRILDPRANRTLVFNDYEFEFRVEFGKSTSNGFGAFDEFHVLENKSASVDVFGTFLNLGPVAENASPLEGGNTIALDTGTGTATDVIFQKEGYVDSEEHVKALEETVSELEKTAEESLNSAEDGLKLALAGSKEVAIKIADAKYEDAGKLAASTIAAAADAEAAALDAEQAALKAYDAAVAAKLAASSDATLMEDAIKIVDTATKADAFAKQARQAADDASTALAAVNAATDTFKQNVLNEIADDDDNEEEDDLVAGYVEYLMGIAKADRENANSRWDMARSGDSKARESALKAHDKVAEGKLNEARQFVAEANAAAAAAGLAAQSAETSSASADSAASEAIAIASNYPNASKDAAAAADFADEARVFATEARSYADSAAFAAAQASLLPITP